LLWWLITASDRYVILFVCGSSANGIYAVSNKIPSIITVFTGVFFQAWQISAIQEAKSRDQTFTKRVLNLQIAGMSIGISFALIMTKLLVESFVGEEFHICMAICTISSCWLFCPKLIFNLWNRLHCK
jgi:O-antigen/teichoic acid export membrane protein